MVARPINLALRVPEFLFSLLILAMAGNIIAMGSNTSIINYCLFCAIFAMLSLIYLVLVAWNSDMAGHRLIPIGLDVANTLFFFCGAVALAAKLGVHSCGNANYRRTNGVFNGASDVGGACHEAQAICAFMFFAFACFFISMIFSVFESRGGVNLSGIRKGGPAMSQTSHA